MPKTYPKTYHYLIKGNVQGVGFRFHTIQQAHLNNIRGTVKNLFNGDVEVYAQGEPNDIVRFELFLETGAPMAQVKRVIKEEVGPYSPFPNFEISY
ncbi:MAG: acylphosphatase [bacterium]|nr:acylphosphatase [bacterium]